VLFPAFQLRRGPRARAAGAELLLPPVFNYRRVSREMSDLLKMPESRFVFIALADLLLLSPVSRPSEALDRGSPIHAPSRRRGEASKIESPDTTNPLGWDASPVQMISMFSPSTDYEACLPNQKPSEHQR